MKSVELTVVGLQYRVTPATCRTINKRLEGGPIACLLEREPDNVHDENAIKVVIDEAPFKGMHIGFLGRSVAEVYAPELDRGWMKKIQAKLVTIDVDEGTALMNLQFVRADRKKKQGKHGKRRNRV